MYYRSCNLHTVRISLCCLYRWRRISCIVHPVDVYKRQGKEADIPKGILKTEFTSEFTKDEFEEVVKKTQHYIKEGDIFQCVVSNRREAEFEGSLLNAYRVLRTLNPSPYMFYLSGGDVELTGASPETLVKLTDGKMYTCLLYTSRCV